jgi:predicted ester cyclase
MTNFRVPAKADPGLSLEEMKQFVRNHFEDFVNRKQSEVALKNFSADFLDHDEPTGVEVGPEAAKKMMEAAYKRWPDLHVTVEDILAEDDKVMVRNSWTATEAAAGQNIEFHGFVLWRFANKKIVERWATITPPKSAGTA